jgi:hypothetical protein
MGSILLIFIWSNFDSFHILSKYHILFFLFLLGLLLPTFVPKLTLTWPQFFAALRKSLLYYLFATFFISLFKLDPLIFILFSSPLYMIALSFLLWFDIKDHLKMVPRSNQRKSLQAYGMKLGAILAFEAFAVFWLIGIGSRVAPAF